MRLLPDPSAAFGLHHARAFDMVDRFSDVRSDIVRQLTVLPSPRLTAVELTDRDRVALAWHAGVPCSLIEESGMLTMSTDLPIAVVDRPGGGFLIAIGPKKGS